MSKTTPRLGALATMVIAAALAASPVAAAEPVGTEPSPERGEAFAKVACATCHLVGDNDQATAIAGMPSFHAMANRPDQTADRITATLIQPHGAMPQLQLSRREIDDVIAYLETLRTPDAGKPLRPDADGKPKPLYPSQS